jgi:hypothetical protein
MYKQEIIGQVKIIKYIKFFEKDKIFDLLTNGYWDIVKSVVCHFLQIERELLLMGSN